MFKLKKGKEKKGITITSANSGELNKFGNVIAVIIDTIVNNTEITAVKIKLELNILYSRFFSFASDAIFLIIELFSPNEKIVDKIA